MCWNSAYYKFLEEESSLNAEKLTKKVYNERLKKLKKDLKPSAYKTLEWWDKYRAKWIDSFLKPKNVLHKIEIQHILGLELSPWHSKVFADIKDLDFEFIKNNVVKKAVEFSKYINNSYLRNGDKSIVLTCGSGFKFFFKKECWLEITPTFLEGEWMVWKWQFDENTSILNFHQTNTNGVVPLNFPKEEKYKDDLQKFFHEQLKSMSA